MTFQIKNSGYNLTDLVRRLGYRPLHYTPQKELSCVRLLGGDYPRFHIYLTATPEVLTFNIHLDQKKPSYEGSHAHGGDYDGKALENEVDRLKEIIYG